jgi:hypothetical protein
MILMPRRIGRSGVRETVGTLVILLLGVITVTTVRAAEPSPSDEISMDTARGSFARFLDSHPEIADVVRHNPQVLRDEGYLRDYPELVAFLEAHPLVKADPMAFLSSQRHAFPEPDFFDKASPVFAFLCVLLAVLWVLRSMLDNRRWSKSAKVQAEIHTKLLDRFGSSQEMLAYMQTDAGKRFLESGTLTLEVDQSHRMPQLVGRIVWSMQAGLILLLVGVGLLWVRGSVPEGAQPLLVLGTLGLTLGAGFALSAAVSYVMSKRLGLLPGSPHREQSAA